MNMLEALDTRVLRTIGGEVKGGGRKLHNEGLHSFTKLLE
jgi:hypothetical protein